jgi:hypothetical protein
MRGLTLATMLAAVATACTGRGDHAATHDPAAPDVAAPEPAAPGPASTPVAEPPSAPPPLPAAPPPAAPPPLVTIPADGLVVHRDVGRVLGVGVDAGGTIWTVDGGGVWARPPGGAWRRFTGVGQLARGERAFTICGGIAGEAYVGYEVRELDDPLHATLEQRLAGDVDRVALEDGNLVLDFHYELHNNNGLHADGTIHDKIFFDETRAILSCVRIDSGPFEGELYFGSNHGLTRVRGDAYGDHRHPTFDYPSCATTVGTTFECDEFSEAIGYVWGLGLSNAGNVLMAADWMFAEVGPTDPLLEHDLVRWTLNSHRWTLVGPPPFPLPGRTTPAWAPPWYQRWPLRFLERARNRAIAQTPDGRYWVASEGKGLVWFIADGARLRPFVEVEGEPGLITSLVANPDGTLWVGTSGAGLWRYAPPPRPATLADPPVPEVGGWSKLDGLPSGEVIRLHMEKRFGKRQLYVGTGSGLAVYTE